MILSKLQEWSRKLLDTIQIQRRRRRVRDYVVNAHHDVIDYQEDKVADYRKQGFSFSESITYDLSHRNFRDYISTWESYQPRLIENEYFPISDDKYLFYLVFSHFVKTPEVYALIHCGVITWLNNDESTEDLYDFVHRHKNIVIKDRLGADGFNVFVLKSDEEGRIHYKNSIVDRDYLDEIAGKCKNAIVQEYIAQGAFENHIYDKSVNTLRVVTMLKPDGTEHEIVAALQRIGTQKSQPVDNFNQGGGSCLINIETGEMGAMMTTFHKDVDCHYIELDTHPDTGIRIKGLCIPNWQKIKETIIELTRKLPFFEYIAWDIVLLDDGIAVIEINMKSSLHVFQIHYPMRHTYLGQKYREHGWLVDDKYMT